WFGAGIVVALLAALAAYSLGGGGSAGSYGWFAYTPLTSSTPETDLTATPSTDWIAFGLLALACLLLVRSAWLAAGEARRRGGPEGRAAWRYIALALVIAIGTVPASAALQTWTDGGVVWSPLTGPVVRGWFANDSQAMFERSKIAVDGFYSLTMLAWFGVASLICAIAVGVVARKGSPLPPRVQQEG
ncbi:MAG: hypothetical protein AB7I24_17575, partial [Candidatus Nanopelagicales bacterium]